MPDALPATLAPMLAQPGRPFDSDSHLFEIKWDGTRALAFVEASGLRLCNRRGRPLLLRYPELEHLARLPHGLLLDGEVVVLRDGRPDFPALLSREQARTRRRAEQLAASAPATYVVFDLLYDDGRPLLQRPLHERRARLAERVDAFTGGVEAFIGGTHEAATGGGDRRGRGLVFSDGIVGEGLHYFEQATAAGLEGIMAKRLDSPYLPGRRSDAWTKCKPVRSLHCLVLGWLPQGDGGIKSLIVAADTGSGLRCVGKVGSGLTAAHVRELLPRLLAGRRAQPLLPCEHDGRWVEPGIYCRVSFVEITRSGALRAPVFLGPS